MTDLIEWVLRGITALRAPVPAPARRGHSAVHRVAARVRAYAPVPTTVAASAGRGARRRASAQRVRPYAADWTPAQPVAAVTAADLIALMGAADYDKSWTTPALAGVGR